MNLFQFQTITDPGDIRPPRIMRLLPPSDNNKHILLVNYAFVFVPAVGLKMAAIDMTCQRVTQS
jgi:hypothetical protein